jgi:hypothetical protein
VVLGDATGQRPSSREEAQANTEQAKAAVKEAVGEAEQPAANFCFGADKAICERMGVFKGPCYTFTNIACLMLGIVVLLALLGIGLHAVVS